jgi:hypothetical protein
MIPSLLKNLVPARSDRIEPAVPPLFPALQGGFARSLAPRDSELCSRARRPRKKRCRTCRQLQLPF